jgi:hypothetical protein
MRMKAILVVALTCLSFSLSASAEVICLKNGKKFTVSATNKVNIKAAQFITTAETSCPTGYTALINVPKEPTVYTGVWNLGANAVQSYAASQISFPKALDTIPSSVVFVEAGVTNTTCTGSSANPTAPAGVLCVYEGFQAGLRTDFDQRYQTYDPAETSSNGVSRFGAALYGYKEDAGEFYAWGTWAVTIP